MTDSWEEVVDHNIKFEKYDEALLVCNKQIEKSGKSVLLLVRRAKCYTKMNEFEKAMADIKEAKKLAVPSSADLTLVISQESELYWETNRLGDSIKLLEENKALASDFSSKITELQKEYHKQYGLEYGVETMKRIERFICWMRENGAHFSKIRMKYYGPDYRGVHAVKPILSGELFLKVPKKLIITPQRGKETEMGAKVLKSGVKLSWDYLVYITIFLLTQFRDEKSWWKPFMDVYPKLVDNFPVFYSAEEKKMLTGTPMIDQIASERREILDEYESIVAKVPEFKDFVSSEDYIKNKTLVISRIFYVKMHGVNDRIMVPLADMFNHHYEKIGQTYWKFEDADDSFAVRTQKDVEEGDAICKNYGQKPNYRFLFYYGFLIDNNKKNAVYLKLRFNKDDPSMSKKEQLLGISHGYHIKTFKYFHYFGENEKTNNKFLGYLRLIVFEGDVNTLCQYLDPHVASLKECKGGRRKLRLTPISKENEKKALAKMKEIAEDRLSKFPETYEQDLTKLREDGLSFNTRNVLIYRSGEKLIYLLMKRMAEAGINSLVTGKKADDVVPEYECYFKKTLNYLQSLSA